MKYRHLIILLALVAPSAMACTFHPFVNVARNVENYFEQADIVIFANLTMLEERMSGAQTAEFLVIKSLKGDVSGNLTIVNATLSSCFYPFQTLDSAYYIFASKTEKEGVYEISNQSGGFVSLEWAVQKDWDWGLR